MNAWSSQAQTRQLPLHFGFLVGKLENLATGIAFLASERQTVNPIKGATVKVEEGVRRAPVVQPY
jgi:hypothetical protein